MECKANPRWKLKLSGKSSVARIMAGALIKKRICNDKWPLFTSPIHLAVEPAIHASG